MGWTKPLRGEKSYYFARIKNEIKLHPHPTPVGLPFNMRLQTMIKPPFPPEFQQNYDIHRKRLTLNGMRPKTIEAYTHALRRAASYFKRD